MIELEQPKPLTQEERNKMIDYIMGVADELGYSGLLAIYQFARLAFEHFGSVEIEPEHYTSADLDHSSDIDSSVARP